ncbi:CLUMA_CG013825, isoform A [Clunio marinus]|uniref:CLUMA_CG013825, isoform A n=1 Tax=Clunio marinus TaxID=568069 RepID=A0A1J1IJZ1_9DIPT|nr:CLUMA_CG013825, isoform A [Clunio marinus]
MKIVAFSRGEVRMLMLQALIIMISLHLSMACDGHKLVIKNLRSCEGSSEQIINPLNISFDVNSKCEIRSNSCSQVKPYNSSKLKVTSFEGNMQLSDFEADLCSKKSIPDNFKVTMNSNENINKVIDDFKMFILMLMIISKFHESFTISKVG